MAGDVSRQARRRSRSFRCSDAGAECKPGVAHRLCRALVVPSGAGPARSGRCAWRPVDALELEPNQFFTLNALASFYVDHRPERLSEAEVRAIYAGDWAANDVERALALQTLGRVYLELGRTRMPRVF